MVFRCATLADLLRAPFDDVIDVRAPSEFVEDHVPGAISLPVLDDEERARVGTIYTRQSPFLARKIGAALVAQNAARHLQGPLADREGSWRPLVYCWRGGQRSGSFASILSQIGWRVEVLEGGYRSYRRLVVGMLHEAPLAHRLVVVDGNTGTAKTELLSRVAARGVQVLDLEGLARHRGSVFGAVPGGQPSQKMFESGIAAQLAGFDPERPVLVEAESSKVGDLLVPPSLWKAMTDAPRIELRAGLDDRARYLARDYGDIANDRQGLEAILSQLVPYHGRARVEAWAALARDGAVVELAGELMRDHYDPRYRKGRMRNAGRIVEAVEIASFSDEELERVADRLMVAVARVAAAQTPDN